MLARLFVANLKMFYRNRQAAFWAMAFPLIFVGVFGLFEFDQPPRVEMAVVDRADDTLSQGIIEALQGIDFIEIELADGVDEAAARVANGDIGYALVIPEGLLRGVAIDRDPADLRLIYDEEEVTTASIVESVIGDVLDGASMAVQGAQPLLGLRTEGVAARAGELLRFRAAGIRGDGRHVLRHHRHRVGHGPLSAAAGPQTDKGDAAAGAHLFRCPGGRIPRGLTVASRVDPGRRDVRLRSEHLRQRSLGRSAHRPCKPDLPERGVHRRRAFQDGRSGKRHGERRGDADDVLLRRLLPPPSRFRPSCASSSSTSRSRRWSTHSAA